MGYSVELCPGCARRPIVGKDMDRSPTRVGAFDIIFRSNILAAFTCNGPARGSILLETHMPTQQATRAIVGFATLRILA